MGSVCYGGKLKATFQKPDNTNPMCEYPFKIPEVSLDGWIDDYLTRWFYTTSQDSVVLKRESAVIKYSETSYCKIYVHDQDGERLCNFCDIPKDYIWDKTTDVVPVSDYSVKVYDLETHKVAKYKMVLEEEVNMSESELREYCGYTGDLPYPKSCGPLTDEQIQTLIDNKEIK